MDITDLRHLLTKRSEKRKYYKINSEGEKEEFEDRVSEIYSAPEVSNTLNNGRKYLLTFIDTTSRRVWLYPMKTKSAKEVYRNFCLFMNDVDYRLARLLSDNDSSFKHIKENKHNITYCLVTASQRNHTVLSLIDRFTRAFRELLYKYFHDYVKDGRYSWYYAYRIIRETYNNTKHKSLYLIGPPKIILKVDHTSFITLLGKSGAGQD